MTKHFTVTEEALNQQIDATAAALSRELLYLKFIQGIPIVGVVGGLSDVHYLHVITDYAKLKYQRRFYTKENKMPTRSNNNFSCFILKMQTRHRSMPCFIILIIRIFLITLDSFWAFYSLASR